MRGATLGADLEGRRFLKSEFYCIRNPVCFRLRKMYGLRSGPETGRRAHCGTRRRSQVEGRVLEAQTSALAPPHDFSSRIWDKIIRKMKLPKILKKKLERYQGDARDEMARNPV